MATVDSDTDLEKLVKIVWLEFVESVNANLLKHEENDERLDKRTTIP